MIDRLCQQVKALKNADTVRWWSGVAPSIGSILVVSHLTYLDAVLSSLTKNKADAWM